MNSKIVVKIALGQPMQVEVQNAPGDSCIELTRPLEENGNVEARSLKAEYFESNVKTNSTVSVENF